MNQRNNFNRKFYELNNCENTNRKPEENYSVRPHRRQSTRHRSPWDSPGKNTGVGCHLYKCINPPCLLAPPIPALPVLHPENNTIHYYVTLYTSIH